MEGPIAILYEHPEWFTPLFAELDRRGVPHEKQYAPTHAFDPSDREGRYGLVVNRMSPSAWLRGAGRRCSSRSTISPTWRRSAPP